MLPFCGYHIGDYFQHWIEVGKGADVTKLPRIFYVNWFRKDTTGRLVWPGFGENSRVLKWAIDRLGGQSAAIETPIGYIPTPDALDLDELQIDRADLEVALRVDRDEWAAEIPLIEEWFAKVGDRLPTTMRDELETLRRRLSV